MIDVVSSLRLSCSSDEEILYRLRFFFGAAALLSPPGDSGRAGLLFKVTRLRMETQRSSRVEANRKVAPYVSDPVGGAGGGIWMMSDTPLYLAAPHSDPQVFFFLHQKLN